MNSPTPVSWLKVCDELKRLEKDEGESYIHRDKLEQIAQKCGAFSHLAADDAPSRRLLVSSLLDRLNTLGMVVHINEPGLDDVVVLNPQWLLDLIVCIVRDFELHKLKRDESIKLDALCKRGVLSESVLKIFWKEEEANIPFLTKFLIKIGVMCELPRPDLSKPQLFLVPAVLSTDSAEPAGSDEGLKFSSLAKIALTFQSFLPEGLLTRLVVALALQVTDYSRCNIEIEDEELDEIVQIQRAPSVFTSRKSLHAAVPVGSSAQVCLLTQSGLNELTVSVLGEASLSLGAEAALLGEVAKTLRNVLGGVTERFYKGITFDSLAFLTNSLDRPIQEAAIDFETASGCDLAEADAEAEIVEEASEDERAVRASAENELAEWLRTCGGVKRTEMRNAMAKVLFDAGLDGVHLLRDAFLANILDKEEADKYFALSANRAAFRAALDKEAAASKVETSPAKVESSFGKLPQQVEPPSGIAAKPDPTKLLEQSQPKPRQFLTDVFISYAWGERHPTGNHWPAHERVKSINAALKRRGLVTWFDCNQDSPHCMQGQLTDAMAEGIDNTACVIVIITDLYRSKVNQKDGRDNCKKEFGYAELQLGSQRMIPVVGDPSMLNPRTWKGSLGLALGGKIYLDATGMTDGPEWEATMDKLSVTVKALVADAKRGVEFETISNIPPVTEPDLIHLNGVAQDAGTVCGEADVDDGESGWRDVDPSLVSRRWYW